MADLAPSSNNELELRHEADRCMTSAPKDTETEEAKIEKKEKNSDDETLEEQELYVLRRLHDPGHPLSLPGAISYNPDNFHKKQSRIDEEAQNVLPEELAAKETPSPDAVAKAAEVLGPLTSETISFLKDLRRLKQTLKNTAKLSRPLLSFPLLNEETRRALLAQSMSCHHADIRLLGRRARYLSTAGDRCYLLCESISSLQVRNSVSLDPVESFLEALEMCDLWSAFNRRMRIEVENFEVALKDWEVYKHFVE